MIKLLVGSTILAVSLVGGCGTERRADEGCPDEEVLAASGACCDPALAVVVGGISDCAGSVVRPDAGTPDASTPDTSDGGDAGGFVFPCNPDEFMRANGDCVQFSVSDGGSTDGGDGGTCTTVITVDCPDTQTYNPQTGLCVGPDAPDGGTECPAVICPPGQTYDLAEQRCRDLVEACRFTCNAGQLLTDDCDCVNPTPACKTCVGALLNTSTQECVVAPVCPGPCPDGTARNNANTCVTIGNTWTFPCNAELGQVLKADGSCYVPPIPWSFPCPVGKQLLADGTTCVDPPKTCVGALLNTTTQQCVVPPVCPGPCPDGQARNNAGTCVSLGSTWTFPCNVGAGEVLKSDGTCYVPLVPPGPCPSNQARDNTGTCVVLNAAWTFPCVAPKQLASNGDCKDPAPEAKVEVSFLVPLSLRPRPQVAPAQTNASMGTVALRNVSNTLPTEVTSLPIQLLVADDVAGAFSTGNSGTVRANERVTGCRLAEWPPSTSIIGPVSPDTNGRLLFQTPIRVDTARFYDLQCSFANLDPVGTGDAYAADVVSGITATSVDGALRPVLSAVLGNTNGSTPTGSVSMECNYGIRRSNGTIVRVLTRPFLTRVNENAPTTVSPGWVEVYAFRTEIAACDGVNFQSWTWTLTATNAAPNTFLETLGANLSSRLKMVDASNATIGTWSVAASTGSGGYHLHWSPGPSWAAGSTKILRVMVDGTSASTTLPDTIKIVPSSPNWKGVTNPSSYPTDMDDPTLKLPEGLLFTFR